ncbi:MAG TPA: GyrI-like domain-containing protein [Ruminiclostridium sp.]
MKGDKDMDYKIVEKRAFKVVGKELQVTTKDGENLKRIPKFWEECFQNGFYDKLCSVANGAEIFGVCMNDFSNEQFTYIIGTKKTDEYSSEEMTEIEIPSSTWAVFESVGSLPDAIQKVWGRIFSEWFPATSFEHVAAPELEVYPQGNSDLEDYRCEVWIPVVKK